MHPADRHYRNQTVRLADLTVITDVIENVTFENCTIEGPAVLLTLGNTTLVNTALEGDFEACMWLVPTSRPRVIGAVVLLNCNLIGCRLRRVGMAVSEPQVDEVRRGFGL